MNRKNKKIKKSVINKLTSHSRDEYTTCFDEDEQGNNTSTEVATSL